MSTISAPEATPKPLVLPVSRSFFWLGGTALLALLVYYFVGIEQGAVAIFGNDTHVHELLHDGRHFLGFPCH
ncbi:CbtB-domain containing protein [Dactylosporangium fulvum]|uniref:CbtB-domain containing protein n=1 Tax=Dactylosporangium fulvum TaxID=53359 RepID=A0ABY5VVW4_9ACTN|nr:CbtB-domain containing protein [Dactylosporangium fulvum]UWP80939.1 CbtB-domain containing protein [Dactylosporangium fulvum]